MKKYIIIFIIFLITSIISCTTPEVIQYTLSTDVIGNGSITLDPTGGVYNEGTVVTVAANPESGYVLSEWSGDLSGNVNPINITMNKDKSVVANFIKGWTQATASVDWNVREGHKSVVFDNKMWVMGGYYFSGLNDVWYSTNGATWTEATSQAQWHGRENHTCVVFDNKMWVIGGYYDDGGATFKNDVWYSSDGVTWTQATSAAQWPGRFQHSSVVFDGKMWVIGGYRIGSGNFQNDVWYSSDGIDWTEATTAAQWPDRATHCSVVFDGKIWVMAGNGNNDAYFNDVWYSSDGVTWTAATSQAQWTGRYSSSCVVFDDKMWIMGGLYYDGSNQCFNDVWYSTDGVTWTEQTPVHWTPRFTHASVVYDNKMWVIGGRYMDTVAHYKSDAWFY